MSLNKKINKVQNRNRGISRIKIALLHDYDVIMTSSKLYFPMGSVILIKINQLPMVENKNRDFGGNKELKSFNF